MRWLLVPLTFASLSLAQYEQPTEEHGSYGSPAKVFGEANEPKAQEHLDGGLLPPSGYANSRSDPLAGYGRAPPAPAETPGTEPLPPGPASPPGPTSEQPTSPSAPGGEKAASTDDTYETKEAPKATVDSSVEATSAPQETTLAVEPTTGPSAPEGGDSTGATDSYKPPAPEGGSGGNGVTEGSTAPVAVESSPAPEGTTPTAVDQSVTEAASAAPDGQAAETSPTTAEATSAAPVEAGYENGAAPAATDAEKPSVPEEAPDAEMTPAAAQATEAPKEGTGSGAPVAAETTSEPAGPVAETSPKEGYNTGSTVPAETSAAPAPAEATSPAGESAGQTPETPKEEGYAGEKALEASLKAAPETPAETSPGPVAPDATSPAVTEASPAEASSEGPASYVATSEAPAAGSSPAAPVEEKTPGQSYPEGAPSGEQAAASGTGPENKEATEAPAVTPETSAATAPAEAKQPNEEGYAGRQAAEEKPTDAPITPAEAATAAPTDVSLSAATEQAATPSSETVATPKSGETEGSGNYEMHPEGSGATPSGEEIPPNPPVGEAAPTSSGESSQEAKYSEAAVPKPSGSGEQVVESGKTVEGSGYTSSEKAGTADKSIESSGTPEEAKPEATGSKAAGGSYEEPAKHIEDRSTDHFLEEDNQSKEYEEGDEQENTVTTRRTTKAPKIDGEVGPVEKDATSPTPPERTTVLEDIILHNIVDERIKRKYTGEDDVPPSVEVRKDDEKNVVTIVGDSEETATSPEAAIVEAEEAPLKRIKLPGLKEKGHTVVIKPIPPKKMPVPALPFNSAEVIVSYREDESSSPTISSEDEEKPGEGIKHSLPNLHRVIIMEHKYKTAVTDKNGKKTVTESRRLNLQPQNYTIIGGELEQEAAQEGPDVRKKIKKMHKLRRLRVVHRSRSTPSPFSAKDLPTYSGDKNLAEDKVVVKEDKYVTAPGERVSTPGVTIPPEASKTDKPADWNTVSPTSDNPITEKVTEPINSLFSTDTTNKEVEPSGYEMGNEPAISTPDLPPIKPEEAVGYDGIPKEDVKKDLPQQPRQDLNRNSGEVKFLRKNSSAERKYTWTPYRFDCSTEEDDKGLLCNEWAQAGLCEQHRPTMFLFCRKTCLCTGPTARKKRAILFV